MNADSNRYSPSPSLVMATLALCLFAGSGLALPPSEPFPGISFRANQAFVGDPLMGMGPGQAGSIYEFWADDAEHMASGRPCENESSL